MQSPKPTRKRRTTTSSTFAQRQALAKRFPPAETPASEETLADAATVAAYRQKLAPNAQSVDANLTPVRKKNVPDQPKNVNPKTLNAETRGRSQPTTKLTKAGKQAEKVTARAEKSPRPKAPSRPFLSPSPSPTPRPPSVRKPIATKPIPAPPPTPTEPPVKALVVAVVGRTGAGKSTLINALVGEHVSIVSNRTQTTRQLVRGILRHLDCQVVLTDTPGFQENPRNHLNRIMNRHLSEALQAPDVVVWVADVRALIRKIPTELRMMEKLLRPFWATWAEPVVDDTPRTRVVVVLNKMDEVRDKKALLPLLAWLNETYPHTDWVPLSALQNKNTEQLLACIYPYAPTCPPLFPDDQYTNSSERFLVAELLRESLYRHLYQELPFGVTVIIDEFVDDTNERGQPVSRISLTIGVSSANYKPMILGNRGEMIKTISSEARLAMEKILDRRIFLTTWVKVMKDWQDDAEKLKTLGYT